ncbi:hypothetical protein IAU59_003096 [Kwoniella sp. CBS 9459]
MAGPYDDKGDQHISPKCTNDGFNSYSFASSSSSSAAYPNSHALDRTESSSSRTSSSSRSSNTSDSSVSVHTATGFALPKYAIQQEQYPASRSNSFAISSKRLLHTLRPRRRSSLPFVHLARRKSTQIALTFGIVLLSVLLLTEMKSHKARQALWEKELSLREWDVRNALGRETNLAVLREEYELKRRMEIIGTRSEEKKRWTRDFGVRSNQQVWGPADEEALIAEVADKWPVWWGSPDVVGRSPFDHRPATLPAGVEKRRFLFLTDYKDYLERMNTHTYEIVDAALRHPQIIVDVWGPGWAGYDRSIPLSANIRKRAHRLAQLEASQADYETQRSIKQQEREESRKSAERKERMSRRLEVTRSPIEKSDMEVEEESVDQWIRPQWQEGVPEECNMDVKFDVVLTVSNIYKETDPHVDALDCGALLIQQLGDCHELRCSYEWYPQANNITVSKYAFELLELFEYEKVKAKYPEWEMGLFGHSPDTGNEWDFYPVPWSQKTADAKVFGYDGSFYPIRTTVTDALREKDRDPTLFEESIVTRHPHPGYTVSVPSSARDDPLETYELNHEYYETHLKLREDFARGMRESKICVFDASLERKMIRKYAQALLSGCVIAADLPTEHEEALSKFVIPLKTTWNIEKINAALRYHLDRPELLQQMAMDGLVYARQHLTTTNKVTHLLQMADHYRQGSRGYEFPYGFSMRCRSYWSGDAYRPPWCSGHRGLEE